MGLKTEFDPKLIDKAELKTLGIELKVLIVISNENESDALSKFFLPIPGHNAVLLLLLESWTIYLGRFGNYPVACTIVKGSSGVTGSQAGVSAAIRIFREAKIPLTVVICTGVCFGLWPEKQSLGYLKQSIGDLLISKRLLSYQNVSVNPEKTDMRGALPEAGGTLLDRFANTNAGWKFRFRRQRLSKIFVGDLLSGDFLVNSQAFVEGLRIDYEKAIGGEMEGIGVASACTGAMSPEWIVVKGISDWGDGQMKKKAQPRSAAAAISLVYYILGIRNCLQHLGVESYPDHIIASETEKYSINASKGTPLWMFNQLRSSTLPALIRDLQSKGEEGLDPKISKAIELDLERIADLVRQLPPMYQQNHSLVSNFEKFQRAFREWYSSNSAQQRRNCIKVLKGLRSNISAVLRKNQKRLHSQITNDQAKNILKEPMLQSEKYKNVFPNLSKAIRQFKKKERKSNG